MAVFDTDLNASPAIRKKLLLVVGMHRSGTSALAYGLQTLGADLGDNLEPPVKEVNETGFWEDIEFNALNTDLLRSLGHDWQSLYLIDNVSLDNKDVKAVWMRAKEWLAKKFTTGNLLALKNPRAARLLSFWKPLFRDQGVDLGLIIAIRNPKSVAESLWKRDRLLPEQSYMLWLEHILPVVVESRDTPAVVVDYDRLMANPVRELHRIGGKFGLETGATFARRAEAFASSFLRDGLRHTEYGIGDLWSDHKVPQDVRRLFEAMYAIASDELTLDAEEVRLVVDAATQRLVEYAPVLGCITQLHGQVVEFTRLSGVYKGENARLHEILQEQQIEMAERQARLRKQQTLLEAQFRKREEELVRVVSARDHRVAQLQHEIEGYLNSTSWRLTRPLREAIRAVLRLRRLGEIYSNYRSIYPGRRGLHRLISRVVSSLRRGGVDGLRQKTVEHVRSRTHDAALTSQNQLAPLLVLDGQKRNRRKIVTKKIAVHAHLYYPELVPELAGYLANIPTGYDLYVSTDTTEKARQLNDKLSGLQGVELLDIQVPPNRGRDIAPMIVTFGSRLADYDFILHVHTKRSPHNLHLRGWRGYLYESLLGTPELVGGVIDHFVRDESLGILYPAPYYPVRPLMRVGGNEQQMRWLLSRAKADDSEYDKLDKVNFPASSMFWLRGTVMRALVDMSLSYSQFDAESGQVDGTLAHALERLFPWFAQTHDLTSHAYLPSDLNVPGYPGAMPVGRLFDRLESKEVSGLALIFDHNLGGGANLYNDQRVDNLLKDRVTVLRVYYEGGGWFVEWIGQDDGLLGVARSLDHLFNNLGRLSYGRVVVNSLFEFPEVERLIVQLCAYVQEAEVPLEYVVHDFYSLCPSQHLLDYRELYCGVPKDENDCRYCLRRNIAATQEADISHWRQAFAALLECADQVTVFDASAVDILSRGLDVKTIKIQIAPQPTLTFVSEEPVSISGRLHIGVLGTMTTVKGAANINRLASYIREQGWQVPITVVGRSLVPMQEGVRVLGSYQVESLPDIIRQEGINIYFMSTIVPETFSRTLSEAMALGLPVVAYDIGAQGARVKHYSLGRAIPIDASMEELFGALEQLFQDSKRKLH